MNLSLKTPGAIAPVVNLVRGENRREQVDILFRTFGLPLIGLVVFLMIWAGAAAKIETSLGQFPGPAQVWHQAEALYASHVAERDKAEAFYERQEQRIAERLADDPDYEPRIHDYPGKPTFFDQIITSLITVLSGFLIASVIAIPVGIVIGLSNKLYSAFNPIIQILKPVSPLAWLPLVTIVVSAVYVTDEPMFDKSFLVSMITVVLCSLWPTMINTAVGVNTVSSDLLNVSKVLRLGWVTHVIKIVLPSSIPMISARSSTFSSSSRAVCTGIDSSRIWLCETMAFTS